MCQQNNPKKKTFRLQTYNSQSKKHPPSLHDLNLFASRRVQQLWHPAGETGCAFHKVLEAKRPSNARARPFCPKIAEVLEEATQVFQAFTKDMFSISFPLLSTLFHASAALPGFSFLQKLEDLHMSTLAKLTARSPITLASMIG